MDGTDTGASQDFTTASPKCQLQAAEPLATAGLPAGITTGLAQGVSGSAMLLQSPKLSKISLCKIKLKGHLQAQQQKRKAAAKQQVTPTKIKKLACASAQNGATAHSGKSVKVTLGTCHLDHVTWLSPTCDNHWCHPCHVSPDDPPYLLCVICFTRNVIESRL